MASSLYSTYLLIALGLALFEAGTALRCRVDHDEHTREGFQDAVRACRSEDFSQDQDRDTGKPNRNNSWQWKPQWTQDIPRFPTKDRNSNQDNKGNRDSNEEESENNRGSGHRWRGNRGRRSPQRSPFGSHSNNNRTTNRHQEGGSTLDDVDACMVHCIFRQMEMLNKNDQPDKQSVTRVMTGKLRDHELRDFLKDAISECFDTLENENQDSRCAVSKSFAMCLEQKGQQNCDDWDDELKKPGNRAGGMNKRLG